MVRTADVDTPTTDMSEKRWQVASTLDRLTTLMIMVAILSVSGIVPTAAQDAPATPEATPVPWPPATPFDVAALV